MMHFQKGIVQRDRCDGVSVYTKSEMEGYFEIPMLRLCPKSLKSRQAGEVLTHSV